MTSGDSMIAWSAAFIDSTVEPPTPSMMSPTCSFSAAGTSGSITATVTWPCHTSMSTPSVPLTSSRVIFTVKRSGCGSSATAASTPAGEARRDAGLAGGPPTDERELAWVILAWRSSTEEEACLE